MGILKHPETRGILPDNKVQGAVVFTPDWDIHAALALLTVRLLDQVTYAHYNRPNEINTEKSFDFLILASLKDLEQAIHHFRSKGHPLPLIIHLVETKDVETIDHKALFPDVEIVPIKQANLDIDPDTTLQLKVFEEVVDRFWTKVEASFSSAS